MEETTICVNCKRPVPTANMTIHLVRCVRSIKCKICGDSVSGDIIDNHIKEHRVLVNCPDCKKSFPQHELDSHRKLCDQRMLQCEYCELELQQNEMKDHIVYCGSRTDRCEECNELVMMKYKNLHLDSNHTFIKLQDEPGPSPSWEQKSNQNNTTSEMDLDFIAASQSVLDELATVAISEPNFFNHSGLAEALFNAPPVPVIVEKKSELKSNSTGAVKRSHLPNKIKRRAPDPPVSIDDSDDDTEETIYVPCENCTSFFTLDEYIAHKDQCKSLQTQSVDGSTSRTNGQQRAIKKHNFPKPVEDTQLPCEFCFQLFPASELLEHQNACDERFYE